MSEVNAAYERAVFLPRHRPPRPRPMLKKPISVKTKHKNEPNCRPPGSRIQKKIKSKLAIRSVIRGTFYCRAGDLGNTFYCRVGDLGNAPLCKTPTPAPPQNAPESTQSQRRVAGFCGGPAGRLGFAVAGWVLRWPGWPAGFCGGPAVFLRRPN